MLDAAVLPRGSTGLGGRLGCTVDILGGEIDGSPAGGAAAAGTARTAPSAGGVFVVIVEGAGRLGSAVEVIAELAVLGL